MSQTSFAKSINDTLKDLLDSEDSFVSQIAEVIRLDPSLTTRVLDLVNSIFFGSKDSERISGVEEASIFLGLNRIRDLIAATPVIEEIFKLGKKVLLFLGSTSGNIALELPCLLGKFFLSQRRNLSKKRIM